ncbi:MAG: DivIVA domain-containing protein [Bacteroidota bacterium]
MKITPIEIRQKTFEKGFRGYEKEEVNAFLLSMSQEWEKLTDENKEYKIKLDMTEKEVRKLKEVENSLYKTLKTAEDTGTHLIEQASKSADLRLVEAQQKSEIMLTDAQNRAKTMIIEADKKAKQALEEALNELKSLERDFRTMENLRDNMLLELKSMATDTLERVSRMDAKNAHTSFDSRIREFKDLLDKRIEHHLDEPASLSTSLPQQEAKSVYHLPEQMAEQPLLKEAEPVIQLPETFQEIKAETALEDKAEVIEEAPAIEAEIPANQAHPETIPQPAPAEPKRRSGSFFDELEAS